MVPAVRRRRDPVGVVDAEDDRGAEDPAEELPDPVADRFTRRDLPRQVERQAEDRVGDGADHADRDRDREAEAEGGLERADRLTAQDDQPWAAEHHDGRSGELGGDQSDCAELGHRRRAYPRHVLGLVTCSAARTLDTDLPLLIAELPEARIVTWDDPDGRLVGVRRRGDPFDVGLLHRPRASSWPGRARVAAVTALWNPPQLIEWNVDKRYLLELAAHGIPIVPTQIVGAGDERPPCEGDIVVKPSVGAGSIGVRRFEDDPAGAHEHIDVLHARGAVAMVQQYVSAVDTHGETGMVFIGGVFSHAFRKEPILASTVEWEAMEGETGMFAREQTAATTPSRAELAVAERVVASLPATAYARVDLLPTDDGPVVLGAGGGRAVAVPAPRPCRPGTRRCRLP